MTHDVRVHLLPALFEPEDVRGGCAVILDILRASTTITHALAQGAACVIPTLDIETAQEIAGRLPREQVLTGGERDGLLIPGFDLDNNPFAYSREVVHGKTIVFTTTNGTKALHRAALADRILIGAFVNLAAVVGVLAEESRPIHLVCAGTKNKITLEDVLCAGAIAVQLAVSLEANIDEWPDDQLQVAAGMYRDASATTERFLQTMRNGFGGRNCRRLGFDDQIVRAATFDVFDVVPEYDAATGRLTTNVSDAD